MTADTGTTATDTWGTVNDILLSLRARHGRLPEYDALERCAATMQAELRQVRAVLRVVSDAVTLCDPARAS